MPLVLGLASSHAPSMFAKLEDWPAIYGTLTKGEPRIAMFEDIIRGFEPVPQPREVQEETTEVLRQSIERIDRAFATMKEKLEASGAETIIIFGDDQGEYLSPEVMSSFCVFVAEEIKGTQSLYILGKEEEDKLVTAKSRPDLARHVINSIAEAGFDVAWNNGKKSTL